MFCQLHCVHCPTGQRRATHRGRGYLKLEDFRDFTRDNPQITGIELASHAEMLLNPDLLEIIKHAYSRNIRLTANVGVNLNRIGDELCEALVKYKFRSLVCAIDGASQETYEIYRVGGHFNSVMENIKKINFYKNKYHSKFPLLHWQFVVFGHNEHEIGIARALAAKLNMSFIAGLAWVESWSPIRDREFVKREARLPFATKGEFLKEKGGHYDRILCTQLWIDPQINWDGRMFGCCKNGWQDFGDVFQEGLVNVFNSERLNYARDMLMGKNAPREDVPCASCELYREISAHKSWISTGFIRRVKWRRKIQAGLFDYLPSGMLHRMIHWLSGRRNFQK